MSTSGRVQRRGLAVTPLLVVALLCAVAALVVGVLMLNRMAGTDLSPPQESGTPAGVGTNGEIVVGPQGTVAVDYYYDYFCDSCRTLEKGLMVPILQMQRAGFAHVNYHPLTQNDGKTPESDYSSRSAGAAYCVANDSPEAFERFHEALMAHMPGSPQPGLRNNTLTDLARQAGADGTVGECVTQDRYEPFARVMTGQAALSGVSSTPQLFVAGRPIPLRLQTVEGVRALIMMESGFLSREELPWLDEDEVQRGTPAAVPGGTAVPW